MINLNERFIDAVSNPAGVIGLFFGLLTVFAILLRFLIYRRLRKKTAAFEQAVSELVQRERDFNETVNAAIAR
ncbi:GIY-YIG nuclease family protein, partial [Escherichia coli]|nr:GIY-YIG nuclease family protein [Escherichia coli]